MQDYAETQAFDGEAPEDAEELKAHIFDLLKKRPVLLFCVDEFASEI